eukprot:TRINITY_DN6163_c0_g1_i3.p1 TRINITY_DN6163_c0_g1~~TRINITY_DN6163_c0_g1_i3.p1  ORF type:complete len:100 (+),score=36.39 TRINITY_DN6163_c0_g1_i3:113-412(+)
MCFFFFFFFKQKTAYEMLRSLVGSEMCIRDSINAEYGDRRERHVTIRSVGSCHSCQMLQLQASPWNPIPSLLHHTCLGQLEPGGALGREPAQDAKPGAR